MALVVENDLSLADIVSRLLEDMGLLSQTVSTEAEALAWLATNKAPELVIVDLMMPTISGVQVYRQLREKELGGKVPIVVLAAHDQKTTATQGANAVVIKPLSTAAFRQTIKKALEDRAIRGIVADAIQESISGLLSKRRAEARSEGIVGRTQELKVPLVELLRLVSSRLDGLRGEDELGDSLATGDNDIVDALDIAIPSLAELRKDLRALGLPIAGDSVVLEVDIPAPRRAHAR